MSKGRAKRERRNKGASYNAEAFYAYADAYAEYVYAEAQRRGHAPGCDGSCGAEYHTHTPQEEEPEPERYERYERTERTRTESTEGRGKKISLANVSWVKLIWWGTLLLVFVYYGVPLVFRLSMSLGWVFWRVLLCPFVGFPRVPDTSHAQAPVPAEAVVVPLTSLTPPANLWKLQECFVEYEYNYCGTEFESVFKGKYCGEMIECMDREMARIGLEVVPLKGIKTPKVEEVEEEAAEERVDVVSVKEARTPEVENVEEEGATECVEQERTPKECAEQEQTPQVSGKKPQIFLGRVRP